MNSAVVITTINQPTAPVCAYAELPGTTLTIVGDRKTPDERWRSDPRWTYLGLEEQTRWPLLNKLVPRDHYCRKMFGYLHAMETGARCIIDTDDDNLPLENYGFPLWDFEGNVARENQGFVNPYHAFVEDGNPIWPRGFPLARVADQTQIRYDQRRAVVGVWQGLADGDPDVDAVYRLTTGGTTTFLREEPIVLGRNTVAPWNSQNTITRRELFSLLYLPITVPFRYTDILRGIVAQPVMWSAGFHLGFTQATVFQDRNDHDLMKDFVSEFSMYTTVEQAFAIACESTRDDRAVSENLAAVYAALDKAGIVEPEEQASLAVWLEYVQERG